MIDSCHPVESDGVFEQFAPKDQHLPHPLSVVNPSTY